MTLVFLHLGDNNGFDADPASNRRMRSSVLTLLSLVAVALAGCADGAPPEDDGFDGLDVDDRTGGIRGVVVDTSITPLEGVSVSLNSGEETVTDATGVFTFTGLEPGTYFVTAEKVLYESAQASAAVEAGVEEPPVLTIQIARLSGLTPFVETHQFDGFYDCAFALFFITDSCDFVVRTAHDAGAPVPRGVQNNVNTGFLTVAPEVQTIIQEGFYDNSATSTFWTMVSSTPIDNACDCSDVDYIDDIGDDGTTYGRGDRSVGGFPAADGAEEVAVRGFIPFQEGATDVDYALSLEFQIFTTLFYSFEAAEGWTLETRDQYPVPQ